MHKILIFSEEAADPSLHGTESTEVLLQKLSDKCQVALNELGPDWKVVSSITVPHHFMLGQLPKVQYILTVTVVESK